MVVRGETNTEVNHAIRKLAITKGADLVGVASAELLSAAPKGFRPVDILPDAKVVLVMGTRLSDATVDTTPSRVFDTMYATANSFLDLLAFEITKALIGRGLRAVAVGPHTADSRLLIGDISQKHAAVASGLGRFGLQSLVLTPQFGPRQRWVTVITNAPLEIDTPLEEELCMPERCGYACVNKCPANVISERQAERTADRELLPGGLWWYWNIDKVRCHTYRTKRREELGWGTGGSHGCAICMMVCPIGHRD